MNRQKNAQQEPQFGYDAKCILRDILTNLGRREMEIEELRKHLCSIFDFDPYKAFKRILFPDKEGVINADILLKFMKENGFHDLNVLDFPAMFEFYSMSRNSSLLSYHEFLAILLPFTNPILRARITQLQQSGVRPYEYDPSDASLFETTEQTKYLAPDIEQALSKLIFTELMLQAETKAMSYRMAQTYGFTAEAAFRAVKANYKLFNEVAVSDFLKSFSDGLTRPCSRKTSPSKKSRSVKKYDEHAQHMNAIIRRMDLDGNGHVTLEEFRRSMGFASKTVIKSRTWIPKGVSGPKNYRPSTQSLNTNVSHSAVNLLLQHEGRFDDQSIQKTDQHHTMSDFENLRTNTLE